MAKSQVHYAAFLAFFFCFLIAYPDMQKAEAHGCEKLSKTWSGQCLSSEGCNKQCINKEKAIFGECRRNWFSTDCNCYFC